MQACTHQTFLTSAVVVDLLHQAIGKHLRHQEVIQSHALALVRPMSKSEGWGLERWLLATYLILAAHGKAKPAANPRLGMEAAVHIHLS